MGDFNGDGYPDFAVAVGNDERPEIGELIIGYQKDCVTLHNDQGGTYVFLGGPQRISSLTLYITVMQ